MREIPQPFSDYMNAKDTLSLGEMLLWLKEREPEYAQVLEVFETHMRSVEQGAYPFPMDWREALKQPGSSCTLLYMSYRLEEAQKAYDTRAAIPGETLMGKVLQKLARIFSKKRGEEEDL